MTAEQILSISVRGLSKRFGSVQALADVDLDVPERSVFGVIGRNGAGKTTLFSVVAGFLRADSGSVSVLGSADLSANRGRFAILPQDAQFQRNVPIVEQLVYFRMLDGVSSNEAQSDVFGTLEAVGLADYRHQSVRSLSHGMLKRLGIAQAFLGHPELIMLDEPTSGLDPKGARQIRELIVELKSRATVVISSHNLLELQGICDSVAVLDHGRLVRSGPLADIVGPASNIRFELSRELTPDEIGRLAALGGVESVRPEADETGPYVVSIEGGSGQPQKDMVVAAVLDWLLAQGVTPRSMTSTGTLESAFLQITGED